MVLIIFIHGDLFVYPSTYVISYDIIQILL